MLLTFDEAKRPLFTKGVAFTVEVRRDDGAKVGTGVVATKDGVILTAYHVIGSKARTAVVRRLRLRKKGWQLDAYGKFTADVVFRDKKADIAVLKLRHPPHGLVAAKFGGSLALVIGTPLFRVGRDDDGQHLSEGEIVRFGHQKGIPEFKVSLHVDCGASGGPVFAPDGHVVGIVLRRVSTPRRPKLGYAIPIDVVHLRLRRHTAVKRHLPNGLL